MSTERRSTECWLSQLAEHLSGERYSSQATQRCMSVARKFLAHLNTRHIDVKAAEPKDVDLYLKNALQLYQQHHGQRPKSLHAPKSQQWWRYSHTTGIKMLLRLVHRHWPPIPVSETSMELFHRDLCQEYERWMSDVRGLASETRSGRCDEARRFLTWLAERASQHNLLSLTIREIDSYMMFRATALRRTTLKRCATDLRSFLRYLHNTRRVMLDFSTAVVRPKIYAFEQIPSSLRAEEIKAVLESTRKDRSRKGIRDYAILMLLSAYGLRAGEVTALRLNNVDWRNAVLRICQSKTSAYLELPLLPAVGNAILDYLQNGRPTVAARELFIRTRAPYRSFRNGSALHRLIHLRLAAAGVVARAKQGPHAFRHARAISMLRAAVAIKEIGDVLGHRSPDSTNPYLKLATEDLRAVALEIPVEVTA